MKQLLAVLLFGLLGGAGLAADAGPASPVVRVQETGGVYFVEANFSVPHPASTVRAVLTDYEQIPRFMPEIKKSLVHERAENFAVVEQEAVSKLMVFSKKIHLVLDITEEAAAIRFRDRCAKSFARYEGAWTFREENGRTLINYELAAKPSFEVPDFILKRLLRRDASQMIERVQREIEQRHSTSYRGTSRLVASQHVSRRADPKSKSVEG